MVEEQNTKQRLEEVLDDYFEEDPEYDLEVDDSNPRRLVGILTSSQFRGESELERQNTIWDLLEEKLTDEQLAQIVIIIANTPDESEDWEEARRSSSSG